MDEKPVPEKPATHVVVCTCGFYMSAVTKRALFDATADHFHYSPGCHPNYKVS